MGRVLLIDPRLKHLVQLLVTKFNQRSLKKSAKELAILCTTSFISYRSYERKVGKVASNETVVDLRCWDCC